MGDPLEEPAGSYFQLQLQKTLDFEMSIVFSLSVNIL